MRRLMTFAAVATVLTLAACKDAGENKIEVERPTVGTTKDTINTPQINLPDSAVVPKVVLDTVPVRRP